MTRWPQVPLGQEVELVYGKSLPARARRAGNVPVLGANGIAGYHDAALIKQPTIIVGRKGSAGAVQLVNTPCFPIDTAYYVRLKHPNLLDLEYLYVALKLVDLSRIKITTGVPGLNRDDAYRETIPLPPIDEQRRIVDILNRANGIRRLRREALGKARQLIPALFAEMFGDPAINPKAWPIHPLGDQLLSCDYGTSQKATSEVKGIPIIRMGNVSYQGDLLLDELKYVDLAPDELNKQRLREGDILFNRTNSKELVGKTGLWDGRFEAVPASYFIRLRVDPQLLHPCYVWIYFNSSHMKHRLFDTARGAIGQANINAKEVRALSIPLPPIELQRDFAAQVVDIQGIAGVQTRAAVTADQLAASLMARCFAG